MCGEDYFHKDWPSSPPSGDGEPEFAQEYLAEFDDDWGDLDDDLPDFGDPEEDDDWDEGEWFGDGDDVLWLDITLEDAIMLMDEEELLEWLTEDELWNVQPERAYRLWDEEAA